MSNTMVTVALYTNSGQSYIFNKDCTDGAYSTITDVITGSGLGSLQGQQIIKVMAWTENFISQGSGVVIVDPQNVPIGVIPVCQFEQNTPQWQHVNIGPINLNWAMKAFTTATVA